MSNEGASVNRHDARDVAWASSPRRHADTTTTIEEVKERRASLVSRANDESMAAILLAVANAYDLEIIVNDDKNIVLRLTKPPAAPCTIAEITPIQERGAPYDVVSRNDDNKSTCDRIATTDESYNRRPIVAAYPNRLSRVVRRARIEIEIIHDARLVARAGMIKKSASFDACERIIEYEVETTGEQVLVTRIKDGGSTAEVVDHRDEDDNGISTSDAMVGEIIDVTPAIRNGVRTFLYSVLISTNDDGDDDEGGGGGVLIERDVVPERVRYRFSLEALQYSIREVTSSSNSSSRRGWKRKGLGIRSSGGQHEPMRNGVPPSVEAKTKKKMKETSTVSLGRINVSVDADDANDNLDALHALPQRLVAPPRSRGWCTNSPLIPRHAARGTTQVLPASLPTPSPGNYQHYQTHQGSAISTPVTINATAEHQLGVPCTSRSEVADEWRKYQRLPQVSGKKAQMIFPEKLHLILSTPVYAHIISWMPNGRTWKIHNKEILMSEIVPEFFAQSKFESFTRQLNVWGFKRLQRSGNDYNAYYHENFQRGLQGLTARESAASMRERKRKDAVATEAEAVKREVEEARDDGTEDEDEIPNHVATGAAAACTSMTGVILRGGMAIVTSSFSEEEIKTLGSGDDEDIPATKQAAMASAVVLRAGAGGSPVEPPKSASEVDFNVADPPTGPITKPSDVPTLERSTLMTENDVLCGQGGRTNSLIGNRRFRALVRDFQPTYLMAKRREKVKMARSVVLIIRHRGGRFLRRDDMDGRLYEVGDEKAEAKTSQAFRNTKTAANALMGTTTESSSKKRKHIPPSPLLPENEKSSKRSIVKLEGGTGVKDEKAPVRPQPVHVPSYVQASQLSRFAPVASDTTIHTMAPVIPHMQLPPHRGKLISRVERVPKFNEYDKQFPLSSSTMMLSQSHLQYPPTQSGAGVSSRASREYPPLDYHAISDRFFPFPGIFGHPSPFFASAYYPQMSCHPRYPPPS